MAKNSAVLRSSSRPGDTRIRDQHLRWPALEWSLRSGTGAGSWCQEQLWMHSSSRLTAGASQSPSTASFSCKRGRKGRFLERGPWVLELRSVSAPEGGRVSALPTTPVLTLSVSPQLPFRSNFWYFTLSTLGKAF